MGTVDERPSLVCAIALSVSSAEERDIQCVTAAGSRRLALVDPGLPVPLPVHSCAVRKLQILLATS
jgi:hypothetical protein